MGAILHDAGVAFRVWAPHAEQVSVTGTFNDWSKDADPLASEGNGYWYADVAACRVGDEYRYLIRTARQELSRIDPYAREVTSSVGNGVIVDPDVRLAGRRLPDAALERAGHLRDARRHLPRRPDDDTPGTFADAIAKFDHLRRLGVNAIQIMPATEFAGDISWGYNPAHIFAVESAYGGPGGVQGLRRGGARGTASR